MSRADDEYRDTKGFIYHCKCKVVRFRKDSCPKEHDFGRERLLYVCPERFLSKPIGKGEPFPYDVVFGWGPRHVAWRITCSISSRRVVSPSACPRRHFAESAVWLAIARILAACEILVPKRPLEMISNEISPCSRQLQRTLPLSL